MTPKECLVLVQKRLSIATRALKTIQYGANPSYVASEALREIEHITYTQKGTER